MEWNIMEPGDSSALGVGSLVEDVYLPADDCEDVLDEVITNLAKEDPKLRNGRRKLAFDKIVEKDLVPLIKSCVEEDIFARAVRLLANLSQPLDVFLQLSIPLSQQCQKEIMALVDNAKACCSDIDFFKSLHSMMVQTLNKSCKLQFADCQTLNHCILLLRNLLHTSGPVCGNMPVSYSSITLQSLLSSFFLSEMDKLVLQLLNHPQKEEWVVSVVQLLSLIFKDYAGVLLDGESDDEELEEEEEDRSDGDGASEIFEFLPSQTSHGLSRNFDEQLHLNNTVTDDMLTGSCVDADNNSEKHFECTANVTEDKNGQHFTTSREAKDKKMLVDEEEDSRFLVKPDPITLAEGCTRISHIQNEEDMSLSDESLRKDKSDSGFKSGESTLHGGSQENLEERESYPDNDSADGVEMFQKGDRKHEDEKDISKISAMVWENFQQNLATEKEIASELSSGSCLMDVDIIISYLRQFATEIVTSGLSSLVRGLMKALMSSYEDILDDSFFMWTVGFFISYARHSNMELDKFKDVLNLDVFGFLIYQGFRNCENLVIQHQRQEKCSLIKYRLHLVVCTLNQMFQVILANSKRDLKEGSYLQTLQRCLAQMGDLQQLFILLIRTHRQPLQDLMYLRDLVHTNHIFLLLLEDWVSRGFLPHKFSMLSHIRQFATVSVMRKYGSLLEQYSSNKESLNVAVLTMMYHVAGDCSRCDVLLQLPILKAFCEIWGDVTFSKYVEFNDLIEYVLETFMSMAFEDPMKCAQNLFGLTAKDVEAIQASEDSEKDKVTSSSTKAAPTNSTERNFGSGWGKSTSPLTKEEQDLLFTWMTDAHGSASIVDDLLQHLKNHGSSATRQQVIFHLLRNGWLEEKQVENLSDEIKELNTKDTVHSSRREELLAGLPSFESDQLLPFLIEKIKGSGFQPQLCWVQEQLLEAAYIRLGVRDAKYRVYVEEPIARFFTLQDKSIPLVTVSEEQEMAMRDPYFSILLQSLGLFLADDTNSLFCRIPHFLTPSELIHKAQQIGEIGTDSVKFDLAEVQDDPSYTEFTPFEHPLSGKVEGTAHLFKVPAKDQSHQWLSFVCYLNNTKILTA